MRLDWGSGYPAARTAMDLPASRAVLGASSSSATGAPARPGADARRQRADVPLRRDSSGAPVIGVPIVNHDNNQHAANENLRLQNLWDGIEVFAALIGELGAELGGELR